MTIYAALGLLFGLLSLVYMLDYIYKIGLLNYGLLNYGLLNYGLLRWFCVRVAVEKEKDRNDPTDAIGFIIGVKPYPYGEMRKWSWSRYIEVWRR